MGETEGFRHELKYRISCPQYLVLRSRLRAVMRPDPHAGAEGKYLIRSVYFDNLQDMALREKLEGLPRREKFRIRYYNDDLSFVMLEKKIRDNGLSKKLSVRIEKEDFRRLLTGDWDRMAGQKSPSAETAGGIPGDTPLLLQELYAKMRYQLLRPKVMVSYVREPYVYEPGNVRVTFDSQIRTVACRGDILPDAVRDIGASEDPWDMILEIKYDAFLPEVLQKLLQIGMIRQQAFSKYVFGRRYG